jgi:hypothetical protein
MRHKLCSVVAVNNLLNGHYTAEQIPRHRKIILKIWDDVPLIFGGCFVADIPSDGSSNAF